MSSGWDRHRSSEEVRFRAACNDAVAEGKRPIKRRVLRRLAEGLEPREVWSEISSRAQYASGPQGAAQCDAFFAELVADRRWRILVAEYVEAERQWSDFFSGQFRDFLEKAKAFFEKLADPQHPVSRTAAAALAAGISFGVTYRVTMLLEPAPNATISVSLKPVADQQPIPVQFGAPAGVTVPLGFTAPGEPVALTIRPIVDAKDISVPIHLSTDLKGFQTALGGVTRRIDKTNSLLGTDGRILPQLESLSAAAERLSARADANALHIEAIEGKVGVIGASVGQGIPEAVRWSGQAHANHLFATFSVEEKGEKRLGFTWAEGTQVGGCAVLLKVGAIGEGVRLTVAESTCAQLPNGVIALVPGGAARLGTLPFAAVVDEIEHRLGRNRAVLSVLRAEPHGRLAVNAAKP